MYRKCKCVTGNEGDVIVPCEARGEGSYGTHKYLHIAARGKLQDNNLSLNSLLFINLDFGLETIWFSRFGGVGFISMQKVGIRGVCG